MYIPTIVEAEVLSYTKWTEAQFAATRAFLRENFITVSFDHGLAERTANLRRKYAIKLPDAAIAATALSLQSPLISRDVKDFKKIHELQVIEL